MRGKNRLRLQKINVGIFWTSGEQASGNPSVLENIVISEVDAVTEVDISGLPQGQDGLKFGAVFLNQDDHAYAKVLFDP